MERSVEAGLRRPPGAGYECVHLAAGAGGAAACGHEPRGEGYGLYSNHFVYLHQLFYSPWGYGFSVPGPNDGMSFALGWSHLLLVVVVWVWISRSPALGDRRLLRFFGSAALCCAF